MARQIWICKQEGEDTLFLTPEDYIPEGKIHVITDLMDPTWSPVDGKHYCSKSKMRQAARAAGCEEIGNERLKPRKQDIAPGLKETIIEASRNVRS